MSSCGTPYIGSKISLVSKAKIRYEGFLYTIDTEESTVTLAKVKSFGTEDRFVENRVPERNEIYEYIVFRGSDIDDLHVSEGPKSRGGQVAQDPAIVQTGNAQPNMYQPQLPMQMGGHFPHQSYGPFGGIPTFGYPIGFRPPTSMPLSSVIGQGSVNERNHRSSPFEQNYRQSPSPPSNSTSGLRNSHKDHQENRNVSPEVTHTSRERYSNEKISNTQAEAPKPQREQKRSWRHKEAEQPSERNVQKDADQTSVRRQQNRDRDRDMEPQKSQQPQRQQREHEEKGIGRTRAAVREPFLREKQKEQGYARNFKKNQETREVEPSSYGRSNDTSKTRNNLKEKDLPRASTATPKKDSLEKEVAEQNYSQSSGGIERGRGRGRGTRRGRGRGSFSRTRFDQDFDFESANAKFNKEEVEKELLTSMKKNLSIKEEDDVIVEKETGKTSGINEDDVDVNGDEGYYDKTKSFFDQISCDSAKERPDTMTKRKERSINTETFGMIPRNYRGRPYRARGGRGSRGRGFGRGQHARRGQGGNRAWVDYEFDFEAAGLRQGAAGNKQGGS